MVIFDEYIVCFATLMSFTISGWSFFFLILIFSLFRDSFFELKLESIFGPCKGVQVTEGRFVELFEM